MVFYTKRGGSNPSSPPTYQASVTETRRLPNPLLGVQLLGLVPTMERSSPDSVTLAEHLSDMQRVGGSIPPVPTIFTDSCVPTSRHSSNLEQPKSNRPHERSATLQKPSRQVSSLGGIFPSYSTLSTVDQSHLGIELLLRHYFQGFVGWCRWVSRKILLVRGGRCLNNGSPLFKEGLVKNISFSHSGLPWINSILLLLLGRFCPGNFHRALTTHSSRL